jgi:membrane-associated phospholipid phosphatase
MFQTEIHVTLQAFSSDFLTWLMRQVTASGYYFFVITMVIAVMFGFSLRKGFLLFQIIAWTAVASEMAKRLFGLPRPFFVDSRVDCLEPGWDAATPFRAMGGKGFLDLPARPAIDAFRLQGLNFGMPSGHASGAVALWGGLAVISRKRALAWFAPFMVALIALTRLYLGVHFLADILGGILLGTLVLLAAWKLIGTGGERFFAAARVGSASSLPGVVYFFFLFVLPLLLALLAGISANLAGFYVGLNAAFTLAERTGLPDDRGSIWTRLARVLLGGLLFWVLSLLLRHGVSLLPAVTASRWGMFLVSGLGSFLTLWGGLWLFRHLGLYRQPAPPVA